MLRVFLQIRWFIYLLYMACNMRKGTFGHLRKVPSRISLRGLCRLIRDDSLYTQMFKRPFSRVPPKWLSGDCVELMTWGCEFESRLRQNSFRRIFASHILKHMRKVAGAFGKKFVLVLV